MHALSVPAGALCVVSTKSSLCTQVCHRQQSAIAQCRRQQGRAHSAFADRLPTGILAVQVSALPTSSETASRTRAILDCQALLVPVQVIVVPIFWNKKADEKKAVIDAAEEVAQQLQAAGVEAALDTTNVLAPGQKYKYW